MVTSLYIKKIDTPQQLHIELQKIGTDPSGVTIMHPKFEHHTIKIKNIPTTSALIIKQEMLSKGGEVATPRGMITHQIENGDILISGTTKQFQKLIKKLGAQPFGLNSISQEIDKLITKKSIKNITIRNSKFDFSKRTYIMGILNSTPDSFSDGGKYLNIEIALQKAIEMIKDGADIIDIGGQSTRPGSDLIDTKTEIQRTIPLIKEIRKNSAIPISIDTFNSEVASAALDAGADIINDISGLRFDPQMASVAAKHNCPVILMHIQGTPKDMQISPKYKDLIPELIEQLRDSINIALKNGINKDMLIIDPGIGFGKTFTQNHQILRQLNEFKILESPILIGTSRKAFIGAITGDDASDRLEGTIATNVLAVINGANILRVHDVKELKKASTVIDSIQSIEEEKE